jgi:hypothetical protein
MTMVYSTQNYWTVIEVSSFKYFKNWHEYGCPSKVRLIFSTRVSIQKIEVNFDESCLKLFAELQNNNTAFSSASQVIG